MQRRILASACLAGIPCRYDGSSCADPSLTSLLTDGSVLLVCPELLGGGSVPRSPCNLHGGDGHDVLRGAARVVSVDGDDRTASFVRGCRAAADIAFAHGVTCAYLKARSPSCGYGQIYSPDGSERVAGDGILAALLVQGGVEIVSM